MNKIMVLAILCMLLGPLGKVAAIPWRKTSPELVELNNKLHGQIIDYTANHGKDNRIWSKALRQRRDMYVYVPPGFDASKRYPLILFLHGMNQDEHTLLELIPLIDHAVWVGDLPPVIVAAPDASVRGEPNLTGPGTFFINSNLGDFEDYLLNDVWDHLVYHFPIRTEREAHVLLGYSMGGFAAFSIGIKHRYAFGVVVGINPPLNMRWMNNRGNYMAKFNPYHWGWRTDFDHPGEVVGHFGLATVHVGDIIKPLFASPDEALLEVSRNNPIELVERTCLQCGELEMFVAYGAHDEFNIDAQVESFLYLCKHRQINVAVGYDLEGRHNFKTARRLWPGICTWLKPRLTTVEIPLERPGHQTIVARKPAAARAVRTAPAAQPQPVNTYFTPPHSNPPPSLAGSASGPAATVETRSPPLASPASSNQPTSQSLSQDLGPMAPPAVRYNVYDSSRPPANSGPK